MIRTFANRSEDLLPGPSPALARIGTAAIAPHLQKPMRKRLKKLAINMVLPPTMI
jgi:hypothetical protein